MTGRHKTEVFGVCLNGTCHVVALQLNAGPDSVSMNYALQETHMRASGSRTPRVAEGFRSGPMVCAT